MFESIVKNEQKQQEKEVKEKIKEIESYADDFIKTLANKGIDLNDAQMVLKCASDKINRGGAKLKLSAIL